MKRWRHSVILSRQEVAKVLGIKLSSVTELLNTGKIKGFRKSKGKSSSWYIPSIEVELYVQKIQKVKENLAQV